MRRETYFEIEVRHREEVSDRGLEFIRDQLHQVGQDTPAAVVQTALMTAYRAYIEFVRDLQGKVSDSRMRFIMTRALGVNEAIKEIGDLVRDQRIRNLRIVEGGSDAKN